MLRFFCCLFLLFVFLPVHAQTLDLSTAIKEVMGDSPVIGAAASQAREAHYHQTEIMGAGFLPKFRTTGYYLTDKKYQFINIPLNGVPIVFPTIFPNSQFNFMAELPLFDGFASTNRLKAAEKNAQAYDERYTWEKYRTEMNVALAFYQALGAKLLRDVAVQNVKVLEEHNREAKLFKRSGISTNYDVLRVEVQASNAATDLADAEDAIVITKRKLAEIMGHDNEERELSGELPVPNENVLKTANTEPGNRADLRALELEKQGREREETASSRYWMPEFSFFTNYTFYNNLSVGLNDWSSYRNSRMVGFQMTWNLFDGLVSYSKAKQSIEKKVQSEKALHSLKLAAARDNEIWARRFSSQCRIYQARMEDIRRSEESVRLAREGKRVGARSDSELLDAELDLYRSRAGAVRAQLAAVEALINLQLAEGRRYLK